MTLWMIAVAVLALPLLLLGLLQLKKMLFPMKYRLRGRHVLITGGSSGIGRSLALLVAKHGANVTILARDASKLEAAKSAVETAGGGHCRVFCVSVDVGADAAEVRRAVARAEEELGPLYLVACCAGFALAQRFEEMPLETYHRLMDVNYYGVLNVLHASVGSLKQQRDGRICVVSSLAGIVGLWGFAGYCASKYALVGLAQTLAQEVKPYNITVTVSYPPDTDTPGFAEENRTKPEETRLICATAGLASPDQLAARLLDDVMAGRFNSTAGAEGFLMTTVGIGMGPVTSASQLLLEVLLMPPFRLMVAFFHHSWDKIVRDCMNKRNKSKKSE